MGPMAAFSSDLRHVEDVALLTRLKYGTPMVIKLLGHFWLLLEQKIIPLIIGNIMVI